MDTKKQFALLRITFGVIWLIDAYFKWLPGFFDGFTQYLTDGAQDQAAAVQAWIGFWIKIVGVNPHFFALVVAIAETMIALSLLTGVLTRYAIYGGAAMCLIIWSTAEGFGGPYAAGSTDIGSAIIYVLVFAALLIGRSWEAFSLEPKLKGLRKKPAAPGV